MMKHKILLFTLAVALVSIRWTPAVDHAAKNITLTINYKVLNTEEGYDHVSKLVVEIDGEEVGESNAQPQTKGGSFVTKVSKGEHDIRAVLWARYEGEWEERTIDNNYSIDCVVETSAQFKKSRKMSIVFDLDGETTFKMK